jgi:DNA polymerase-3 subunit delta'
VIGFDDIVGQRAPLSLVRRMLATRRIPHALLLQGPESVGKATAARAFARALLCTGEAAEGCGACAACRLVAADHHPDLLRIERLSRDAAPARGRGAPADDSAGELRKAILVEQIRELSRLSSLSPRVGRRRVFVIDPADRMNAEAQNALLKTLEEPPGAAVLMLVSPRPHLVLPTVRSRCFTLPFGTLPVPELAAALEQRGFESAEALARASLAGGRPGRALSIDLASLRARREELLEALETVGASAAGLAELGSLAARLSGKDETDLLQGLELVAELLRDAARAAVDPRSRALLHADLAGRLRSLGARLGAIRAASLVRSVDAVRGDLRFNVNRTLAAESLLAAVAGAPDPAR